MSVCRPEPGIHDTAERGHPAFKARHGAVPYIAGWSAEVVTGPRVIQTSRGIGYADETVFDRDEQGVLWNRALSRPGVGEPCYQVVHPVRQCRCMRRLLCQVCAEPADQDGSGVLWLLRDHREDWTGWPEGMGNAHPPLCLRCARIAVKACPWLRPGYVAVHAHSEVSGVSGGVYRAGGPLPEYVGTRTVAYRDVASRWIRAGQLVRTLRDCKIVNL